MQPPQLAEMDLNSDSIHRRAAPIPRVVDVVVSFTFDLYAFYGGVVGLSASDESDGAPRSMYFTDSDMDMALPPVPDFVLPEKNAVMNPFHPLILENIPPNTYGLVDIEQSELLYIVGTDAVLKWGENEVVVGIGDPVYLGQVISVDPRKGTVTARLNKGGIMDQVELAMDLDQPYKQARGSVQLSPTKNY